MLMIRKQQPDLNIPIVAITANVLENEKERLINLGFNAYISKPIDEKCLKDVLLHKAPLQTPVQQKVTTVDHEPSIDFELTLVLSANNEKLVKATFAMLQLEIPDFIEDLDKAIEMKDKSQIAHIMHKLQGITCYIGLPQLKKLLTHYETLKLGNSTELLRTLKLIRNNLKKIDETIELFNQTDEAI